MIANYLKIFCILLLFFFPISAKSKVENSIQFNERELSSYLSAVIAQNNENNKESLKFFKSSKNLKNKHDEYFKKYILSLVLNQNVKGAIQEIRIQKKSKKVNFFEADLLLLIDNLQKKKFNQSNLYLKKLLNYTYAGTFEAIIYESLKSYSYAFENKKILNQKSNFKNIDNLNVAFLECYLKNPQATKSFENLINSTTVDYSRYLFFYISHLIENNKLENITKFTENIDEFNSPFLVLQTKIWLEKNNFDNFSNIFSCDREEDILAEYFFLIANLYSTEGNLEKSNFYLSLSEYLNTNFKYNLSLMVENYFQSENYDQAKEILKKFNEKDGMFYWFKIKKITSIISKKQNQEQALNYLESKYSKIKYKNNKLIFDMANIYKNYKKFDEAIKLYSSIMNKVPSDSIIYGDLLYRRGGSYERIGDYKKSDKDLLLALQIIPDNSYILNYLAYSWLERNINISKAVHMLEIAYEKDNDNPYITDSIGWAYYLTDRYEEAEKLIRKALMLMPEDPIVNDHYGDILWSLNKKIQAKYYWESILKLEDTDETLRNKIKLKLLFGPSNDENS